MTSEQKQQIQADAERAAHEGRTPNERCPHPFSSEQGKLWVQAYWDVRGRSIDEGQGLIVKINTTPWPGGCTEIEDFICNAMESSRDGIAESALGTAENVVNAMGRLVALMAAKGHLTAPEVAYIAKDSFDDGATFDIE